MHCHIGLFTGQENFKSLFPPHEMGGVYEESTNFPISVQCEPEGGSFNRSQTFSHPFLMLSSSSAAKRASRLAWSGATETDFFSGSLRVGL